MAIKVETRPYKVKKGDNLWDIVGKAGFPPKDWRKIFDAPYNRDFKKKHKDPNVIQPGEVLNLPKYAPRDVAVLTDQADRTRHLLIEHLKYEREMDKAIKEIEAKFKKNVESVEAKQIAALRKKADAADKVATDAGVTCQDMYSCAGGGAASQKFSNKAKGLRKSAAELEKAAKARKAGWEKKLAPVKAQLKELASERARVEAELNQIQRNWLSAHQSPY